MLKFITAVSAAVLLAGAASAQDADAVNWTGPYVGLHAGWGFDDGSKVLNRGVTANNATAIATGVRASEYNQNRGGAVGGGQIGYNLQRGNIVLGAEGDFSYMDQRRSNGRSDFFGTDGRRTRINSDLNWMGTARARAGYAVGRGMFYVTGGYAFGRVKGNAEFDSLALTSNYYGRHAYTAQGWTAGGGLEFKPFTQGTMSHVSLRLEGNYYDLGRSHIYALQTSTQPGYYVLRLNTNGYNGRVGINYAF